MTVVPRGGRLHGLDAIRGLAALAVLLFHVLIRYESVMRGEGVPEIPLFPGFLQADAGLTPVLCFFMISGFVIAWTVDRSRSPLDFIVSRASRIYPAYWFAVALAVVIAEAAPLPGWIVTPGQVLVNMTMAQAYLMVPDVAGVFWSLAVELMFYVYILAVFATGQWRRVHWFALGWAVLALAYAAGLPVPWRVSKVLLLPGVPLLVAGMMIYRLWQGQTPRFSALVLVICAAGVSLGYRPMVAGMCAVAGLAIAAAAWQRLPFLAARPLIWLGGISYSLYLCHEQLSYVVMRAVDAAGWPHGAGIVLAIIVSLALGWAVTVLIERPAMRAIRQAWRLIRPEASGANSTVPPLASAPAAGPAAPGSPG